MSEVEVYRFDEEIHSALVVVAHPDDIDFGSAGTVAALTARGVEVSYCLVTSGDAGGDASVLSNTERAQLRETEQRAAAKEVGVEEVNFLGWPDGRVEVSFELRKAIAREIRRVKPQLVITQSPERNYERIFSSHPDHMAAGEATLRAVYPDARNPHAFAELLAEGFAPHVVEQVWLAGYRPASMVVDITDTFEKKYAALRRHESQVGVRDDLETMLRSWAGELARDSGLEKGALAEGFKVIRTK